MLDFDGGGQEIETLRVLNDHGTFLYYDMPTDNDCDVSLSFQSCLYRPGSGVWAPDQFAAFLQRTSSTELFKERLRAAAPQSSDRFAGLEHDVGVKIYDSRPWVDILRGQDATSTDGWCGLSNTDVPAESYEALYTQTIGLGRNSPNAITDAEAPYGDQRRFGGQTSNNVTCGGWTPGPGDPLNNCLENERWIGQFQQWPAGAGSYIEFRAIEAQPVTHNPRPVNLTCAQARISVDIVYGLKAGKLPAINYSAPLRPGADSSLASSSRGLLFAVSSAAQQLDCKSPSFASSEADALELITQRCSNDTASGLTEDACLETSVEGGQCGPGTNLVCPQNTCCSPDGTCGSSPRDCCPAEFGYWEFSDGLLECSTPRSPPSPLLPPSPPGPPPLPPSPPPTPPPATPNSVCTNTCPNSPYPLSLFGPGVGRHGFCDDGGDGSGSSICDFGTDCNDCGPRVLPSPPPSPPSPPSSSGSCFCTEEGFTFANPSLTNSEECNGTGGCSWVLE